MVTRKSFYLDNDSPLPFIKQRPWPTTGVWKQRAVTSPVLIAVVDGTQPPALHIRELAGQPTLEWPIRLPKTDPRGVAMGDGFECWKKARAGRTGISGNWFSIKTGRMHSCHSMLEARIHAYLDMCPFVVEFRTQYPSWDRDEYARYYSEGKTFPKTKVMTIDFMVTLSIPGLPYLVYHGISGKPRALIASQKSVARHQREASAIARWGGTHEVMDEFVISDMEFSNLLVLKTWFRWTEIAECMDAAYRLAQAVRRSKAKGVLDRVLPMIGLRLGHSRDDSYRLLGVAVFLGYLWVDHRHPLRIDSPMVLLP